MNQVFCGCGRPVAPFTFECSVCDRTLGLYYSTAERQREFRERNRARPRIPIDHERPDLFERANCAGMPAELFFPGQGESCALAKAVCDGCEIREECLQYAISHNEKFGIWGGTSERERIRIRRARRAS